MKRPFLLLTLVALSFTTPGCVLAVGAAAGTGYLISREVRDEYHTARVARDSDTTWSVVVESLEILQDVGTELALDPSRQRATAKIEGAEVRVSVEAYDLDSTIVRITAEKLLVDAPGTAERVLNYTLDRIEETD